MFIMVWIFIGFIVLGIRTLKKALKEEAKIKHDIEETKEKIRKERERMGW